MTTIFMKGASGPAVAELGAKLSDALDGDAAQFPGLATATLIDDDFDAAIRRWQGGVGLIADGVIGPLCQSLLGLIDPQGPKFQQTPLTMAAVSRMFPATKPANLARYLPYVEAALGVTGLTDAPMVLGALGTIRAETEGFVPISEFQSRFNTEPGKPPFSLYDFKKSLGNGAVGDGARYRGRGFVQLTGKANYAQYGAQLKLPLSNISEGWHVLDIRCDTDETVVPWVAYMQRGSVPVPQPTMPVLMSAPATKLGAKIVVRIAPIPAPRP